MTNFSFLLCSASLIYCTVSGCHQVVQNINVLENKNDYLICLLHYIGIILLFIIYVLICIRETHALTLECKSIQNLVKLSTFYYLYDFNVPFSYRYHESQIFFFFLHYCKEQFQQIHGVSICKPFINVSLPLAVRNGNNIYKTKDNTGNSNTL